MVRDFKLGDLVWAKMKGFPSWPGKIYEPEKEPLTKKKHHYILFFGPENHAWIADTNIVHHHQKYIDRYENKKTMASLRVAINEIADYAKSMPSTSQEEGPPDEENSSSDDDERSKPCPSKNVSKGKKGRTFKKGYFGTKNVLFKRNSKAKKRKANEDTDSSVSEIPAPKKKPEAEKLKVNKDKDSSNSELIPIPPPREKMIPTKKKIGFIGLGKIGASIMRKVALSGHNVTIWDRNMHILIKEKFVEGVEMAESPKDVAQKCDIIFSCVVHEDVLIATVDNDEVGVIYGLDETKGYVEMTCVGEKRAKEIAKKIEKTGALFLEAPLSSCTVDLAKEGKLKLFASGRRELFDSCESVFHTIAEYKQYIGEEIGQANALSVICNSLGGAISASLAESMAFAHEMHVSQIDVLSGLNVLGHGSDMVNEVGLNIVKGKSSLYSLRKQQQAMHLTLDMAEKVELPMEVTAAANQVLVDAKRTKLTSDDSPEVKLDDPSKIYLTTKQ